MDGWIYSTVSDLILETIPTLELNTYWRCFLGPLYVLWTGICHILVHILSKNITNVLVPYWKIWRHHIYNILKTMVLKKLQLLQWKWMDLPNNAWFQNGFSCRMSLERWLGPKVILMSIQKRLVDLLSYSQPGCKQTSTNHHNNVIVPRPLRRKYDEGCAF